MKYNRFDKFDKNEEKVEEAVVEETATDVSEDIDEASVEEATNEPEEVKEEKVAIEPVAAKEEVVAPKKAPAKFASVLCELCNVRAQANPSAPVIKTVSQGAEFKVLGDQNGYVKVLVDGTEAFIRKDLVKVYEATK